MDLEFVPSIGSLFSWSSSFSDCPSAIDLYSDSMLSDDRDSSRLVSIDIIDSSLSGSGDDLSFCGWVIAIFLGIIVLANIDGDCVGVGCDRDLSV